jgi:hypothetical protein
MKKGKTLAQELCSCIKQVKKSLKNQNKQNGVQLRDRRIKRKISRVKIYIIKENPQGSPLASPRLVIPSVFIS